MVNAEAGGSWAEQPAPLPSNAVPGDSGGVTAALSDLECISVGNCVAVGSYVAADGIFRTRKPLVMSETAGVWSATTVPLPTGAALPPYEFGELEAVSCPAPGTCVATGNYSEDTTTDPANPSQRPQSLIVTQSGADWTAQRAPLPSGEVDQSAFAGIADVACAQPGECAAVGEQSSAAAGGLLRPVLYTDTGGHWTAEYGSLPADWPSGAHFYSGNSVNSIACPQVNACVAVGAGQLAATPGAVNGAIFTQAPGGGWSAQRAPLVAIGGGDLVPNLMSGIKCPTVDSCIAVGVGASGAPFGPGYGLTFAARAADGTWSARLAPQMNNEPLAGANDLDCAGPSSCVVIGTSHGCPGCKPNGFVMSDIDGDLAAQELALPPAAAAPVTPLGVACGVQGSCAIIGRSASTTNQFGNVGFLLTGSLPVSSSGSLPPDVTEGPGAGLAVSPPAPTQPLAVTVANGGGGGTAGAQDPTSLAHGSCDPGTDTGWLHVSGIIFTCIVSGDVWDDPDLISAKRKCGLSLATHFTPFTKALKWRKFFDEGKRVKSSLKTLGTRLRAASYPGKLTKDAKLVDDMSTGLDLITTPDQAILTAVSSRRIFDALVLKLGKVNPAALKLAQDIALVKATVNNLIETVSGVRDIKDCITAFTAP